MQQSCHGALDGLAGLLSGAFARLSQVMPLENCHPGLQKQSDIPVVYSDEALQLNSRAAAGCQGHVKRITSVIGNCKRWALDTSDCVLVKL